MLIVSQSIIIRLSTFVKVLAKGGKMKKIFLFILVSCLFVLSACSNSSKKSGTYTATEKGYGGEIAVTLTVSDGKIVDAKITGDKETSDIGAPALATLEKAIVSANSHEIDNVTGATITSTAVKKATKAAMTQAGLLSDSSLCSVDGEMTLESINDFLNSSADMGEGTIANAIAIIPMQHVDGPRNESDFYAFVNFKYTARNYIKYQITYLSCTCRSSDVNYWMTAYVELTLPESGDINDATIRTLSFDYDSTGNYLAGYWGDSNPTPAGSSYEDFKKEYIPFFIGKDYAYISTLSFVEDISSEDYSSGDGRGGYTLDSFTGSSVSTNNIIRMLNALFDYHATDDHFK